MLIAAHGAPTNPLAGATTSGKNILEVRLMSYTNILSNKKSSLTKDFSLIMKREYYQTGKFYINKQKANSILQQNKLFQLTNKDSQ